MPNKLEQLMQERQWTQQELADQVNALFLELPELARPTKKNPTGEVNQQTVRRLIKSETAMSERWLEIFSKIFNKPHHEIHFPEGVPEWLASYLPALRNAKPKDIEVLKAHLNIMQKYSENKNS